MVHEFFIRNVTSVTQERNLIRNSDALLNEARDAVLVVLVGRQHERTRVFGFGRPAARAERLSLDRVVRSTSVNLLGSIELLNTLC